MSYSGTPCTSTQFARLDAVADPLSAAQIRREFSDWLRRHFTLDATKASDVVLAVNEAMANAAEFAYGLEQPGPMHVRRDYDGAAATLTVTVTDEGAWRNVDHATKDTAVAAVSRSCRRLPTGPPSSRHLRAPRCVWNGIESPRPRRAPQNCGSRTT